MSYIDSLNSEQRANIDSLKAAMVKGGITNPYSIAALLAIISKESSFYPKRENMNYSAPRIKQVWTGIGSAKAAELANNPQKLANYVYAQKPNGYRSDAYGNVDPTDGYDYRGGGYNQLTWRGSYKKIGNQIGEPLEKKPQLIENPKIASKVVVQFMQNRFKDLIRLGHLKEYGGAKDINDFKDLENATMAFYHANTGAAKPVFKIKNLKNTDTLGGMKKALERVPFLYDLAKSSYTTAKKNPITTIIITALFMVSIFVLIKTTSK